MSHHDDHACNGGRLEVSRRSALLGAAALYSLCGTSVAFSQVRTPSKLVVINVRGGLDGLSAVAPYGDPSLAKLRAPLMAGPVGTPGGMLDMGGFFGLHPAMVNFHSLYQNGQAGVVHAVGNVAQTRSHVVGQDYLQSGAPELLTSGWLNRALIGLPPTALGLENGLALSSCPPLLMDGSTPIAGWAPHPFTSFNPLYAPALVALTSSDPNFAPAYASALRDRTSIDHALAAAAKPAGLSTLQNLAWAAGTLLTVSGGPTVAAIETGSYDTHVNQIARLNTGLADLDGAFLALYNTLGAQWANTIVLTITEFGRTAYYNGSSSGGTDHGTGFAVLLAGGALNGGQVVTSWPGLSSSQLFQGRDLAPTIDIRSILAGVLRDLLAIPSATLAAVFPEANVPILGGLVRVGT